MVPSGVQPDQLFLQSALPMAMVALDGDLLAVNDALCRLLRRDRERLVGRSSLDLAARDGGREDVVRLLAEGRAGTRTAARLGLELVLGDETRWSATLDCTLVHTDAGDPWYVAVVIVDAPAESGCRCPDEPGGQRLDDVVAVRVSAELERARARQDARMRARFTRSHLAKADVDRRGVLTDVNDAFTRLLGKDRDALVGRPAVELLDPSVQENGEVLDRVLRGEVEAARVYRALAPRNGSPRPILVDLTLLRDPQDRPDGAALIVIDLSRLRESERRLQEQSDFFHALSLRSTDAALVTDAAGRVVYASPSSGTVLGREPDSLVTRESWELAHPADRRLAAQLHAEVVASGGSRTSVCRVETADGGWLWIEQTLTNLLDTAVGGVVGNLRDVTERVTAEQALRRSESRYRAIAETAEEGIWTVDREGRTTFVNEKMAQITGLSVAELLARPATSLLDRTQAADVRERARTRATRGTERYEVTYEHPDGVTRTLLVVASPLPDEADGGGSLAMVSDVTEARQAEEALRRAALHDALTGLPNRSLLLDRLERALAKQGAGASTGSALLFLDLDQFKLVNDSRGHELGDRLLVAVAERLAAHIAPEDTVARFGGDEFVVVCEQVDEQQAERVADDLLAALDAPFDIDGELLHTSASIGIACTPPVAGEDLLRYADAAMYTAKAAGRGLARSFDRSLAEEVDRRYALGVDLRAALAEGHLALHYQPIIDLNGATVIGLEALARWESPEHGSIPPARFVALAELIGLAPQLDAWALRTATADLAALRRQGRVPDSAYVAVNLSARNIASPDLEAAVVEAAAASGIEPGQVVLELTESAVMDDAERAVEVLQRLRRRGFGIAIDDFGTGYSSLAYLKTLPMTSLKIDRSFVADLADDADALAIVASIVDLARAVGVSTVAEGVETAQQLALLRRLGCSAAQGWLWSRAVPVHELSAAVDAAVSADPGRLPAEVSAPRPRAPRAPVMPMHGLDRLLELHSAGASLVTIAAALNRDGYRTPQGARWHRTSVARAVAQAAYPDLAPDATERTRDD